LKSINSFNQPALEVICFFHVNYQVHLNFFNVRIGSSPGLGAKQVNHLNGSRVSGFFYGAIFGPGLAEKSFLIKQ